MVLGEIFDEKGLAVGGVVEARLQELRASLVCSWGGVSLRLRMRADALLDKECTTQCSRRRAIFRAMYYLVATSSVADDGRNDAILSAGCDWQVFVRRVLIGCLRLLLQQIACGKFA
jgi:hypothetical protein